MRGGGVNEGNVRGKTGGEVSKCHSVPNHNKTAQDSLPTNPNGGFALFFQQSLESPMGAVALPFISSAMIRPYSPSASAKMSIRIIATNTAGCFP